MSGAPTVIWYVHDVRNTGSPTDSNVYGDRAFIVVSAWESHVQGEGKQAAKHNLSAGKPDAVKVARPVWAGKIENPGFA
ncbi:hypothetical protein U27_00794 [Candidatus Vecturithrix granuli]|uniref:Uncharacterized protein n=1 Tax=Vecturithrix granuli TaxID=1499967 RepID=A0A081C8J1_VECG1|nr:hypothetical protein U27_00794 [Candidatus Vecturithrix granuli]